MNGYMNGYIDRSMDKWMYINGCMDIYNKQDINNANLDLWNNIGDASV